MPLGKCQNVKLSKWAVDVWMKASRKKVIEMGYSEQFLTRKRMVRLNLNGSDITAVLNGNYTVEKLAKYSRKRLEGIVTRLVKITSNLDAKAENCNCKRPKWWPRELIFVQPLKNLKKCTPDAIWNQVLMKLVVLCREFYVEHFKRLQVDEEAENQVHQSKQIVLKEVHQHLNPVVRLRDIIKTKERTITKTEFAERLNLVPVGSSESGFNQPPILKSVRLATMPNVPFSSDYAQLLVRRDKQTLPIEVHLKKLERTERYLKHNCNVPAPTIPEYEVTYDKKEMYSRVYRFPVRQFYQITDKVTFLKGLCKPVSVLLIRYDELKRKPREKRKRKVLKVVLPRLKIEPTKLRNGVRKRNT